MRIERLENSGTEYVSFKCPGCREDHTLPVTGPRAWGFNGDLDRPTLTPSILCRYHAFNEKTEKYDQLESTCHSFVRNGEIQFLSDCSHALKGQTVSLKDIEGAGLDSAGRTDR
jgi:hypothetical protein